MRNFGEINCRTALAARYVLEHLGMLAGMELGIDHDLGDDETGYDILKWALPRGFVPDKVHIVSMNPVGVKNMTNLLLDNGFITTDGRNFERQY